MSETCVYLGNLTVKDFEERTGVSFSEEDRLTLEDMRINSANEPLAGKLHIFDMPFQIHCGEDVFKKVLGILRKYDYSKSKQFGLVESK